MVSSTILLAIKSALKQLEIPNDSVQLEHPADESHGDYSSNAALICSGKAEKNPRELAEKIVDKLKKDGELKNVVSQIEIAGPGFINFWLSKNYLINSMNSSDLPTYHLGKNKKVMVEFAHPNTHKPFHIGHLRNIVTGESLVRILEVLGNKVVRANYEGDIGLHIAKCLWALSKEQNEQLNLDEKVEVLGKAYVEGNKAYENDEKVRAEIYQINMDIYEKKGSMYDLWKKTRKWSLDYFDQIYKRVYSHFDRLFFESEVYERGLEVAKEIVKKGILEESDGAIIFKGEEHGLHTRVFVTSEGNPTYEGKDLGLAELETSLFGNLDKIIHVVDVQQSSYFETLFKVLELIDKKRYKNVQQHFPYGYVRLKKGKMSSRLGNVILGEWLLDEVNKRIKKAFPEMSDDQVETVSVAAVKYSLLKVDARQDISFGIDQSISLEGNSGPYLLYTYARCQSVLVKSTDPQIHRSTDADFELQDEELSILRSIYKYPEVVLDAGKTFSPNLIANYLYDLAQKYNLFYQKHQILKSNNDEKQFRLALTDKAAQTLKNGLDLLGVKTLEKM